MLSQTGEMCKTKVLCLCGSTGHTGARGHRRTDGQQARRTEGSCLQQRAGPGGGEREHALSGRPDAHGESATRSHSQSDTAVCRQFRHAVTASVTRLSKDMVSSDTHCHSQCDLAAIRHGEFRHTLSQPV